MAVTT